MGQKDYWWTRLPLEMREAFYIRKAKEPKKTMLDIGKDIAQEIIDREKQKKKRSDDFVF